MVQEVTLPNASRSKDPVGYMCHGTVFLLPDTPGLALGKRTVFAERISNDGTHVAFNKDSILIKLGELPPYAVTAELCTPKPSAFSSNGVPIKGSYWCRQEGHYLEWRWGPISTNGRNEEAAINLSLLVTNKIDGRSGFSIRGIAQILTPEGEGVYWEFVDIHFLPVFEGDSKGIGYAAYGSAFAICRDHSKVSAFRPGLSAAIAWPGMGSDHHFSSFRDSALLAWIETG